MGNNYYKKSTCFEENADKSYNYYEIDSFGVASGFLIAAIRNAGLVTLKHAPSPMNFLIEVLNRPVNQSPYVLIPLGYPYKNALVPDLKRKDLSEVITYYE